MKTDARLRALLTIEGWIDQLSPEQIRALPRLVAWFTGSATAEDWADLTDLERIYPQRKGATCSASSR